MKIAMTIRTEHLALRNLCKNPSLAPAESKAVSDIDRLVTFGMMKIKAWNSVFSTGTLTLSFESKKPFSNLPFSRSYPLLHPLLVIPIMPSAALSTLFTIRIAPSFGWHRKHPGQELHPKPLVRSER
jgi:hypothetical protein